MHRFMRIVIALVVALGVQLVPGTSYAGQPPNTNLWVSDEMVDGYCKVHGNKGMDVVDKEHPTAYSYRCVAPDGSLRPVNMDAVCSENNKPQGNVVAYFPEDEFNLATGPGYVWRCFVLDGLAPLGGVNLLQYCKDFNYGDTVVLMGKTVADWRCTWSGMPDLQPQVLDMRDACTDNYAPNTEVVIAKFNYFDPYSVRCYR